MRLKDFDGRPGKKVWLDQSEVDLFISMADRPEKELAFELGARSGLRRTEITSVTPNDFSQAPDGFLRVWEDYAKRDNYRETILPDGLASMVRAMAHNQPPDDPVVDVHGDTVRRWVRRAAEECMAETDDPGWQYLSPHDLRRTWGTDLLAQGVLPSAVMWFGGWNDWEVFRDHYLGEFSPEVLERERSKASYINSASSNDEQTGTEWRHHVPASGASYKRGDG